MAETTLTQVSEHVYWLSPGKPDRPSLCAVVGTEHTLLVDTGASAAHARLFLEALSSAGVPAASYAVLTHWHWDHVFGAAELGLPLIAHHETAKRLALLAGYTWDDAALDQRVTTGEEILSCANDIKQELPEPRDIRIVQPDIVFRTTLDIHLGSVTCHIQHVGGDHAHDACIVSVSPDRVTVLGDCLYDAIYTPVRHYTQEKLFPLLETVLAEPSDYFIEGHTPEVVSRADLEAMATKMHQAASLVEQFGPDALTALSQLGPADEDTEYFVNAFLAGKQLSPSSSPQSEN